MNYKTNSKKKANRRQKNSMSSNEVFLCLVIVGVIYMITKHENAEKRALQGLKEEFRLNLYGQPLVVENVPDIIERHWSKEYPSKSLVISFHGMPGTGKSHAAKIIKRYMNDCTYIWEASSQSSSEELNKIFSDTRCEKAIVIFDRADKMQEDFFPEDFLDQFMNLIHPKKDKSTNYFDYRKWIFIFISNTGSRSIANLKLRYWKLGFKREHYSLGDFEDVLSDASNHPALDIFKDNVPEYYRSFVLNRTVFDHYIPFLPLTADHVLQCAKHELFNKKTIFSVDTFIHLLKDSLFAAPPFNMFSIYGCSHVGQPRSSLDKHAMKMEEKLTDEL